MSFQSQFSATKGAEFPGGFAEGTNLQTPCGPRRVECLRPGDLLVTRTGGLQPVRLLWSRELRTGQGQPPAVRLRARAVGPMMPRQDTTLAPDQPVLVPGYRIAGKAPTDSHLVAAVEIAGAGGHADPVPQAVVCLPVLDDQHVLLADGLLVAGFRPGPAQVAALSKARRAELLNAVPDLADDPWARTPLAYPSASGVTFTACYA